MSDPTTSVAAFAEQVLRRPLWDHQIEAAESGRFVTTIAAARRSGKTTLIETLAAWTCFRERNVKAVILSAGQDSARRVTESIGATLAANPLTRGAVVDDFATRITLSNGSEIVSLPASQRQVRGFGRGVKLLVIDEAGFVPEELWTAARYVALDERANGSRIILCGTPWGGSGQFFRRAYQAGVDGDPEHASFQWTYKANPLLDHAYLERERDRVSPAEYAAEVLGEWSDAAGSLFSRELLDAQTADLDLPDLGELKGPARGIIGCDWGASFDRSAAVALYRLPTASLNPDAPTVPRFVALPYVWPAKARLGSVVDAVASSGLSFRYVASETNGIGAMPTQELFGKIRRRNPHAKFVWVPINTTAASKTAGYGALLSLLESGQLVLPRHPDLLRQLAGLRFEQRERGFTRIEADDAVVHDDIADALMLAALPFRSSTGKRTVSRLATLARDRRAPADAPVPELDCPTVTTGGGLRVYARPPLQSVGTREFSLYATPLPPQPTGIKAGRFLFRTTAPGGQS